MYIFNVFILFFCLTGDLGFHFTSLFPKISKLQFKFEPIKCEEFLLCMAQCPR